jgi:hypothetical protein
MLMILELHQSFIPTRFWWNLRTSFESLFIHSFILKKKINQGRDTNFISKQKEIRIKLSGLTNGIPSLRSLEPTLKNITLLN